MEVDAIASQMTLTCAVSLSRARGGVFLTPMRCPSLFRMDRQNDHARALAEAHRDVDRLERELQQSGSRPPEVRRYLITRLELARKRVQRLVEGPASGLLLLLACFA